VRFWPRTAITIVAAAAVVTPVAGGIWWILSSKNPVNAATILAGILAPVAIAVTLLAALGKWWWKGIRGAGGAGSAARLAELFLSRHRRNRIDFLGLLEDAFDRQVLRQAGAAYQFRHAALQVHLARRYDSARSTG
jgi:hypothetical protein